MERQDQDIMVGISPALYRQVKIVAAQKNLSMREYLEEVLEGIMSRETSTSHFPLDECSLLTTSFL